MNNNTTQHTPTPWVFEDGALQNCDFSSSLLNSEEEWRAVGIEDNEGFAASVAYAHPDNATFIVKAVNCHEELVAALNLARESVELLQRLHPMHETMDKLVSIRTILDKVQS